jgi:hypothetical protein
VDEPGSDHRSDIPRVVQACPPAVRVLIEELPDAAIVAATEAAVEAVFRDAGMPGDWTVALAPSETRGRWDVAVRGPQGTHFFSFSGSARQVPALMTQYLSRCLSRMPTAPARPDPT